MSMTGICRQRRTSVRVRTERPFRSHQYGSSKAYIPDRPFWFVDDSIIGASRDVILDWLDKEVIHG